MSIWDLVVVALIIGTGAALWFYGRCSGWVDWLIKFSVVSLLLFSPYFFWDDIAAYWRSSDTGPVKVEAGWW